MRVMKVSLVLLLLGSCNDIDGWLQVFNSFSLIDEDGKRHRIAAGEYSADFSYDRDDREVELEIDDFDNGDDVDFKFYVPHMDEIDFDSDLIEIDVSEEESGQGVGLNALVERRYNVTGPHSAEYTSSYCRDERSRYYYPYVVFDVVETNVYVEASISRGDMNLAEFDASACVRRTDVRYCVDCYGNIHHRCTYNRTFYCD